MAENLKSFLHVCAARDLCALRALQGASEEFCEGQKLVTANIALDAGKLTRISVRPQTLSNAIFVALCAAGESAKVLMRKHPHLVEENPQFPWIALKHMRDEFSHPTRNFLNGVDPTLILKDWRALDAYIKVTPANRLLPTDNRLFDDITINLGVSLALRTLYDAYRNEPSVLITDSPAREKMEWYYRGAKNTNIIPKIIAHFAMRHTMMGIGDAIEYTSVFFRYGEDLPIDPRSVLAIRNRAAHFADLPGRVSRPGDDGRNTITEFTKILPQVMTLRDALKDVPRANAVEKSEAFAEQYAAVYYHEVLQKLQHDPEKAALMDATVKFITSTPKNGRVLQNAVVMAMANLLEVKDVEQGKAVLDYMISKNGAIREPEKMRAAIHNVPHVLKTHLDQFLNEVRQLSVSIGEGMGKAG